MGLRFKRHDLPADFMTLARQYRGVDQDAGALHLPDDLAGRHLEVVVDVGKPLFFGEPRVQRLVDAQRDIGILGGVARGALDVDLVEADLPRALAAQVYVSNGVQPEVAGAQLAEVVALVGFDDIALQHGVMFDTGQCDAVVGENVLVIFRVLQHFFPVDRDQPGFQLFQNFVARQLFGDAGGGVGERNVAGLARRHG